MKAILKIFYPDYVKVFLQKMLLLLGLMSATRIIFYIFHYTKFKQIGISEFIYGFWFDLITVSLCLIPLLILYLLPFWNRNNKYFRWFINLIFILVSLTILTANLVDIEYFKYTEKRSTADLFTIVGAGDDIKQLLGSFIRDFWYLILFFLISIYLLIRIIRRIDKKDFEKKALWQQAIVLVFYSGLFMFFARGGFTYRPTGIIEANNFTEIENTPVVTNTMFTLLKTYGKSSLEVKTYMSEAEAIKLYNPIRKSQPQHILDDKTNVVIIILEGFGIEFMDTYGNESYTPFLDSLMKSSWYFEYGFANGKKSIEAIPTILSSMPSFMEEPYISSNYANNKANSLIQILKKNGYSTGFYHGATNGSMRFDAYTASAGIENYFGRKEYNNDKHFDKTWGILDEYFNPWSARKMTELKEPFAGVLFTLSSHHPFFIPKHMRDKVKKCGQPLCGSINYGDYSLKLFFEEAKKQAWYNNTVFVLMADHSPGSTTPLYSQRHIMYRVPIAIYAPNGKIPAKKDDRIFQHADVMPTVIDLLNIDAKYYAYGKSIFAPGKRNALAYLMGTYHYFEGDHMLNFSNDEIKNFFPFKEVIIDPKDAYSENPSMANQYVKNLKAIIQRYNKDLITNNTFIK